MLFSSFTLLLCSIYSRMSVATVHGNLSVPETKNVNRFFEWLMGLKHLNIFRYKKKNRGCILNRHQEDCTRL